MRTTMIQGDARVAAEPVQCNPEGVHGCSEETLLVHRQHLGGVIILITRHAHIPIQVLHPRWQARRSKRFQRSEVLQPYVPSEGVTSSERMHGCVTSALRNGSMTHHAI